MAGVIPLRSEQRKVGTGLEVDTGFHGQIRVRQGIRILFECELTILPLGSGSSSSDLKISTSSGWRFGHIGVPLMIEVQLFRKPPISVMVAGDSSVKIGPVSADDAKTKLVVGIRCRLIRLQLARPALTAPSSI